MKLTPAVLVALAVVFAVIVNPVQLILGLVIVLGIAAGLVYAIATADKPKPRRVFRAQIEYRRSATEGTPPAERGALPQGRYVQIDELSSPGRAVYRVIPGSGSRQITDGRWER